MESTRKEIGALGHATAIYVAANAETGLCRT